MDIICSSKIKTRENIYLQRDDTTIILYQPPEGIVIPLRYDFKNMILDMLEQMDLFNTYEYEIVCGWSDDKIFEFMKFSSLNPLDLLLEINRENQNNNMGVLL
ncbi:hypothetical protein [Paenibacillus polymyxa]|uniref:hypothetical protein n=1 Tax=Paenibacillus polymyxa TaxID=1406 RepID=UPI00287FB62E|nr:hypothetical protein [Paenibacillus polymyxa]